MAYTVTSAACTVYLKNGSATLLYKGSPLPADSDLADGEAKRLVDGGFVVKGEVVEETPERVFGADSDPAEFNSKEVLAYLAMADEVERARVLDAEAAGKARKG